MARRQPGGDRPAMTSSEGAGGSDIGPVVEPGFPDPHGVTVSDIDDSMTATVNRERVLLVGGQRALVMQLAHPLVAAGVAEHSDFPARPMERLRRTLDLSLPLIYGTDAEAEAASAGIRAVHERVTGSAAGRPYAANDPDLLLWVNATLVDTTLLVYERFVRPLPERDRRRYYLETVDAAELFGIPRAV